MRQKLKNISRRFSGFSYENVPDNSIFMMEF